MAQTEDKTLDTLLESTKTDLARMTENEFKTRLLPILTANVEDANLDVWLDIAGSWQRPIAVTDAAGNDILFVVPALVGSTGNPVLQRGDNSAYELIENAQRKMRVVPRAGDEMLIKGLRERVSIDGDRLAAQRAWNYIYSRYGYPDLVVPVDEEEAAATTDGGGKDFSGYDEA